MPEDMLMRIERLWEEVRPLLLLGPCRGCECLRGLLVELQLSLEALPATPAQAALLEAVGSVKPSAELHACLGCDPCTPGNLLADFYRARNASEAELATAQAIGGPQCGCKGCGGPCPGDRSDGDA